MEVLYLIMGCIVSGLAFWGGVHLRRCRRMVAGCVVGLFVLLMISGVWPWFTAKLAGGGWGSGVDWAKILLLLALLGLSWARGNKKWQRGLILLPLLALGACVLLKAGSPLVLRYVLAQEMNRAADAQGLLQQSTVYTCAPASAAMLLDLWGIEVTEGDMAAQSHTGVWLGTHDPDLRQAMRRAARAARLDVALLRTDWDTVRRLNRPFIAPVELSRLGRHAVVVCSVTPTHVIYADPTFGQYRETSVAEFQRVWTGTLIVVEEAPLESQQVGDRGPAVEALQRDLVRAGCADSWIPGVYDEPTERAVKLFQFSEHLTPSGVADPVTLLVLRQQTRPWRGPMLDRQPPPHVRPHGPLPPRLRRYLRGLVVALLD